MAFKIYTKKGDAGDTGLFGGKRLPKDHIRISAYGTVDELNAHTGMLRDLIRNPKFRNQLLDIQRSLFTVGSYLASEPKMYKKIRHISDAHIERLEQWIDEMEQSLPALTAFILPGGHPAVSQSHIARTVCRRAEREIVALDHIETVVPVYLKYINRLSDYFFVLSRQIAVDFQVQEIRWLPK